jgi:hypothetical protein
MFNREQGANMAMQSLKRWALSLALAAFALAVPAAVHAQGAAVDQPQKDVDQGKAAPDQQESQSNDMKGTGGSQKEDSNMGEQEDKSKSAAPIDKQNDKDLEKSAPGNTPTDTNP